MDTTTGLDTTLHKVWYSNKNFQNQTENKQDALKNLNSSLGLIALKSWRHGKPKNGQTPKHTKLAQKI